MDPRTEVSHGPPRRQGISHSPPSSGPITELGFRDAAHPVAAGSRDGANAARGVPLGVPWVLAVIATPKRSRGPEAVVVVVVLCCNPKGCAQFFARGRARPRALTARARPGRRMDSDARCGVGGCAGRAWAALGGCCSTDASPERRAGVAATDARAGPPGALRLVVTVPARRGKRCSMSQFANRMDTEAFQVFWAALARRVHQRRGRADRLLSQAGLALGHRVRRRASAPRPRPQRPLPDVCRARGDRAGHSARRDDPVDRAAPGPRAVDDLTRAGPQRRPPRRPLPRIDRARARL